MKNHYKHLFGFINIDDDTFYLTKSGVWSEVGDLSELGEIKDEVRTEKSTFKDWLLLIVFIIYMFINFVLYVMTLFESERRKNNYLF